MSKKQERIKYLVGIYNAINNTEVTEDDMLAYDATVISRVLETVKHLLKEDGIVGLGPKSKVGR